MSSHIAFLVSVMTSEGKPHSAEWVRGCPARHPSSWAKLARVEVETRCRLEGWTLCGAYCTVESVPALGVAGIPVSSVLADYAGELWTFRHGSVF